MSEGVSEDDLARLHAAGSKVEFTAGQMLIERGQPGAGLFVVLEGRIVVDAREETVEYGPGTVFGERALLSAEGRREARVRAVSDGVLLAVPRTEVDRLCSDDPAFAERLARSS